MDTPDDPALRRVLKAHAEYFAAPADLRSEVMAAAHRTSSPDLPQHIGVGERLRSWVGLPAPRIAIAFAAGACAALLGVRLTHGPTSEDAALLALVSDHARALVTLSTIEVSSRSTHTVKPWLSAKLGYSPNVVDLAELGFPLMGGRRGFLGSEPAAVMVYAYGEHEIDLYALRADATAHLGERLPARDGYNLRAWHEGGLRYVAVSDIAAERLDEFSRRAQERQRRPVE